MVKGVGPYANASVFLQCLSSLCPVWAVGAGCEFRATRFLIQMLCVNYGVAGCLGSRGTVHLNMFIKIEIRTEQRQCQYWGGPSQNSISDRVPLRIFKALNDLLITGFINKA